MNKTFHKSPPIIDCFIVDSSVADSRVAQECAQGILEKYGK
ncbi:MAG: hypothetical protein ACTTH5_07890 [Wolinella sp.]